MSMIIKNRVRYCSTGGDAENIVYNNAESGMEATNIQDAIDELNSNLTAPVPSYVTISTENKNTVNSASYTVDVPANAVRVNVKKTSVSNYTTAVITIGDESINLSTGSDSKIYTVDCTNIDSISVVVTDQYSNNGMNLEFEFQKIVYSDVQFKFGIDGDGNYGYYGADGSLIPFSRKGNGTGIAILSKIQIGVHCYNKDNIQPDYFDNEYFSIVDGVITCKKAVNIAGFAWNDSSVNNGAANAYIRKNGSQFVAILDRTGTITPSVGYTTLAVGDVISLHTTYQHQGTYQATNSGFTLIAY